MRTASLFFTVIALAATPSLAEQLAPGTALKPGERACYGWSRPATSLADGDATRLLFELHKEAMEGQDPVIWGRLYGEVVGSQKAGYTYDGCGPTEKPGELHCSYSCDGGSLTLAAANGGLILTLGADGVRVRSCGTSNEDMGAFAFGPEQVGGVVTLALIEAASCRAAMEHFEKLLDEEEKGID